MPGIVGVISRRSPDECRQRAKLMVSSLVHEPAYVVGTYEEPQLGLYSGWVAHKGSFSDKQVFFNEDGQIGVVFSGVCRLDAATGAELRRKGHDIGADKGTWLPHIYEEDPGRFFEKLNGLFSGVLIDKGLGCVFLFNDRYGAERLYVCETDDATYFASEAKALLKVLPESRAFDLQGIAEFLACGCTLNCRTLFRSIALLPGGSLWTFGKGKRHKCKYFLPSEWESQPELPIESFQEAFQHTIKQVMPRYFDSPDLAISLTGGLDTRMMMVCRPPAKTSPICYTFGGVRGETLDARLAAKISSACGLEHRMIRIDSDFFSDFKSYADRTVYIADGSFGVTGSHELYLNRKARDVAMVRLAGAFGGEVLRGVSTFKALSLSSDLINESCRGMVSEASQRFGAFSAHPVTFAAFFEIPWNIYGSPAICRSQLDFWTPYLDNDLVKCSYQVPEILRRSPLPATRLITNVSEQLAKIPTDMGLLGKTNGARQRISNLISKVVFKLDYLSNDGLPKCASCLDTFYDQFSSAMSVLGVHQYLHYRRWFRTKLASYIMDSLADSKVLGMSIWNQQRVRQLAQQHISGRENCVREINSVLTLAAVDRLLFHDH